MFKVAIKSLIGNKLRLGPMILAIILGVGFVVSSFVLRDGLQESFSGVSQEFTGETELQVTATDEQNDPITIEDLELIDRTTGVRLAEGFIVAGSPNSIQVVKDDGTTIPTEGRPPQLSMASVRQPEYGVIQIRSGRYPWTGTEWMVDVATAEAHDLQPNEIYEFVTPAGRRSGRLVGTFSLGDLNETNGMTIYGFKDEALRDFLDLKEGFLGRIDVRTTAEASPEEVIETLSVAMGNPPGADFTGDDTSELRVTVIDRAQAVNNVQKQFDEVINLFSGVLLGFALTSLFVSIFTTSNTFSVVTAQRTSELGLLRALGATPRQIRVMILTESALLGVVSSGLGIATGVGIAAGIQRLLKEMGFLLPPSDLIVRPATIVIALTIGTTVAVVSALSPANEASRVSPIEAISDAVGGVDRYFRRYVYGSGLTIFGVALLIYGAVNVTSTITYNALVIAVGAVALFVGLTMASPVIASQTTRMLGRPLEPIFGAAGELSAENTIRNPRRTAATSSALMVGLALVTTLFVLGNSFDAQIQRALTKTLQGDYVILDQGVGVPDGVVDALQEKDELQTVNAISADTIEIVSDADPKPKPASTATLDYNALDELIDLGVAEGSIEEIGINTIAVLDDTAAELGLAIGETVSLTQLDTTSAKLTVVAIYRNGRVSGDPTASRVEFLVSPDRFEAISNKNPSLVVAKRADGTSVAEADQAVADVGASYPNLDFDSAAQSRESLSSTIDTILNVLTLLLMVAITVSLLGVANTVALSVVERTREIGLLRAVGMLRGQVLRMIMLETFLTTSFGSLIGVVVGIALGSAVVTAIPNEFLSTIAVPWLHVCAIFTVGSFTGVIAAALPAVRAGRMNVLRATAK